MEKIFKEWKGIFLCLVLFNITYYSNIFCDKLSSACVCVVVAQRKMVLLSLGGDLDGVYCHLQLRWNCNKHIVLNKANSTNYENNTTGVGLFCHSSKYSLFYKKRIIVTIIIIKIPASSPSPIAAKKITVRTQSLLLTIKEERLLKRKNNIHHDHEND